MTDNETIKALECCKAHAYMCENDCPLFIDDECGIILPSEALDLINRLKAKNKEFDEKIVIQMGTIDWQAKEINRQKAENDDLFYKLTGVMCSVDKWLEGVELEQDEVNRAATMREKTLQIVEKLEAVLLKKEDTMQLLNEEHQYTVDELQRAKAEIERLEDAKNAYKDIVDTCEAGAIKEFAEKLKEGKQAFPRADGVVHAVLVSKIDRILAEMVGDNNVQSSN